MSVGLVLAAHLAALPQFDRANLKPCAPTDKVFSESGLTAEALMATPDVALAQVSWVDRYSHQDGPVALVYFGQGGFRVKLVQVLAGNAKRPPVNMTFYEFADDSGSASSDKPAIGDVYFFQTGDSYWRRGGTLLCLPQKAPAAP
ncbi:hypothetical protein QO010_002901 [Caulobacter ginsengisoli]|uniref:Uncharacterized protein n=1 Tax=Caulobacter ginsengisoli TaxID=400775 RepID=A0ABU0ISX8_9CAUL|nr:hypothetical protein [Caulobacter ginsengisoli]MDQ0465117.1 hypothetical protein [Caulobacter ginsengisoli]